MLMTYLTGAVATSTDNDNTNSETDSVHLPDPKFDTPSNNNNTLKRPSLNHTPQSGFSTGAPSPAKSFPSIMFSEADNMSYASGDLSREGSFMSTGGRTRKRSSRPKTSYTICQPPPKALARQKLHVRARPILQLHKLAVSSRPMPAYELLHSAIFSPSLSRAILKTFRAKHGLCPADLAIVKADKYHQHEEAGAEEDESRDVLALICKGRKAADSPAKAKIFLDDGSEWDVSVLPTGGYEFSTTDEHGLTTTARWVVKRPRGRRSQSASDLDSPSPQEAQSKKFNFSTISPHSRRHPIIANLSSTMLDIQDTYNMPAPVPSALSPSIDLSLQDDESPKGESIETTPALHTLITATAVWVALREGWTPGYRYEDALMRSPSSKLARSTNNPITDLKDAARDDAPRRSTSIARIFSTKRRSTASTSGDGPADETMSRNSSLRSNTAPQRRARAESNATVINRTTWPRPDMRGMRKHTASSVSNYKFSLDQGEEMTEEDEVDTESAEAIPVTPSKQKHASAPVPLIFTPTPVSSKEHSRTPSPAKNLQAPRQRKRESSAAADGTTEMKKTETTPRTKRGKRKSLRKLFCGMV